VHYAVAIHAPIFPSEAGVVRRRRAFQGLKPSSGKIGRNVCARSLRFSRTIFLPFSQKTPVRTSNEEIGRVVRRVAHVVRRVRFRRPGNTDDTSDGKIGACSHGFMRRYTGIIIADRPCWNLYITLCIITYQTRIFTCHKNDICTIKRHCQSCCNQFVNEHADTRIRMFNNKRSSVARGSRPYHIQK